MTGVQACALPISVTEHVIAPVTVKESVFVIEHPAELVEYETAPVPDPPDVVSFKVVP